MRLPRLKTLFFGLKSLSPAGDGVCFFAARTLAQVSQFTIFVVAARVLTPAQFGVFAVMSAVAILFAKIGEAGWREFVIASRNAAAVDQAMTASIIGGAVATTLCLSATGVAYALTGNSDTTWLLGIFALWLLPAGMTAVQSGMMVRRERIAALSFVQGTSELAGLAVAVGLLLDGGGLLSLVYGRLACQFVSVLSLVSLTRWFPPFRLEKAVARELLAFSGHILATRLIAFMRSYSATFAVGSLLGAASAGFFRAAERLVVSLSEILAETVQMLAWKSCRRSAAAASDDVSLRRRLSEEASFLHPVLLATAAPIFVGIALISSTLIEVVLGPQWKPAALVASLIAIRQLLLMPGFLTEPLLATAGEIRRVPPISTINAVVALSMVVVCAPFGITAVALGQIVAATISLAMSIRLQRRYAGIDLAEIALRVRSLLPAIAIMGIAIVGIEELGLQSELRPALVLVLEVAVGALAYCGTLLALQSLTAFDRRLLVRPVTA